jgi:hypothetical protein
VSPKPKRRRKLQNVFFDNQGFPDQSDEYNQLLHSINRGPVLRKLRRPMPNLNNPINPNFNHPFVPEEHKELMQKKMEQNRTT